MPLAPVIVTKLSVPTDTGQWVARERLLADLAARHHGRRCRACVLSAAPGFGKTTLAAQWGARLQRGGDAVAWLTLEPEDDSPERLCAYLLAAANRAQPAVDLELASLLEDHLPDAPVRVLTAIINALAAGGSRVTLVLDDCHHLGGAQTRELLRFLVARSPENLHLVLATRPPAPIPLGALRAHDEITEIDAAALRFDGAESEALFNRVGQYGIGADALRAICARTEGWPAALRVVSLTLGPPSRTATGDAIASAATTTPRALAEYLTENVLDHLDGAWLRFLLATSILDRLCAAVCDAVTATPGSQELLERTERAGLFLVALDGERRWFRYHQLFADVLRQRLAATPELSARELHLAASGWFASEGLLEEAVDHALVAKAADRAAGVLEQRGMLLVEQGRMSELLRLVDKLHPADIETRPRLHVAVAWASALLHEPRGRRAAPPVAPPADPLLAAELDLIRAIDAAFDDDVDGVAALVTRARPHLGEDPWLLGVAADLEGFLELRRNRFDAARAAVLAGRPHHDRTRGALTGVYGRCFEGVALAQTGDLDGAARVFERAVAIAVRDTSRYGYAARMACGYLGAIRYEQNDLAAARELLEAGFSLRHESGLTEMSVALYPALCRLHEARGDHDAALAVIYEGARQAAGQRVDRLAATITHEEVRLHLAAGDLERAARLCAAAGSGDAQPGSAQAHEQRQLARARLCIAQGRPGAARLPLAQLLEAARADGRRRFELTVRLVTAVAARSEGDGEAARGELAVALSLGEAQGAIRSFTDEGPAVLALVRKWQGPGSAYLARLIASFAPEAAALDAPAAAAPLIEPLNVRELQILRLVEEGRANKDVSAALGIRVETVKWHLKNAYKKLGVATRTGAIHAARAVGVLGAHTSSPRLKAPARQRGR